MCCHYPMTGPIHSYSSSSSSMDAFLYNTSPISQPKDIPDNFPKAPQILIDQWQTLPPEVRKYQIKITVEKLLAEARKLSGENSNIPPLPALSFLSVRELWTILLIDIFLVYQDKCRALGIITYENSHTFLVAFCLVLQKDNLHALTICFNKNPAFNINPILKIIAYLKLVHSTEIKKEISEFFPEEETSAEQAKALAKWLLFLQNGLLSKINPVLKNMEADFHKRETALAQCLRIFSLSRQNSSQARALTSDFFRIVRLFSIYASLNREKIENVVYHSHIENSPVYSLGEQSKLYATLAAAQNPYADKCEQFLFALYKACCVTSGLFYNRKEVEGKIRELERHSGHATIKYFTGLMNLLKNEPITLREFYEVAQGIIDDLSGSVKKGKRKDHPKRAEIKKAIEEALKRHVEFTYQVLSSGFESLKALFSMNKSNQNEAFNFLSGLHKGLFNLMEPFGNHHFEQPVDGLLAAEAFSFMRLNIDFSLHSERYFQITKQQFAERNKIGQASFFSSRAQAEVLNASTIEDLDKTVQDVFKYKRCSHLLVHLSPIMDKCYRRLLQLMPPPPSLEEYEWFHELEAPRVIKKQEVKATPQKTTVPKAVETPPKPVVQQKLPEPEPPPLLHLFVKAKDFMLGNSNNPDMRKMDPELIYYADAVYHLFHATTLLEMFESHPLRFCIPELINAIALVQEQILTPRYIREKKPETVIHDLKKMSSALNIKTRFSFNFGSQSYRYPHSLAESHERHRREVPTWLQEMIALETGADFAPKEYLQHSLEGVAAGLEFSGDLLGSDEWKRSVALVKKDFINKLPSKAEPPFQEMVLFEQLDKRIEAKNNPRLKTHWNDLKVHARRFKRAEESFRACPEQKFLSVHARAIVMSAQYFVEHTGHILAFLTTEEDFYTHRLSDFAILCNWEAKIEEKWMKCIEDLDIEKSADYPHWAIYTGKSAMALDLLNRAYTAATIAAESGEGFQKGKQKPGQIRDDLRKFADNAGGLIKELTKLLNESL